MSRKPPLSSRSVEKLSERERAAGLDPADDAARWLEEHDPDRRPPCRSAPRRTRRCTSGDGVPGTERPRRTAPHSRTPRAPVGVRYGRCLASGFSLRRHGLAGGRLGAERAGEPIEELQYLGMLVGLPAFEEAFELLPAGVVDPRGGADPLRRSARTFRQARPPRGSAAGCASSVRSGSMRAAGRSRRVARLSAVKRDSSSSRSRSHVALGPSWSCATSAMCL